MKICKHFLILQFAMLCPLVANAGDTTETHIAVSGSLLDIHGQGHEAGTIFRGTRLPGQSFHRRHSTRIRP